MELLVAVVFLLVNGTMLALTLHYAFANIRLRERLLDHPQEINHRPNSEPSPEQATAGHEGQPRSTPRRTTEVRP